MQSTQRQEFFFKSAKIESEKSILKELHSKILRAKKKNQNLESKIIKQKINKSTNQHRYPGQGKIQIR